MAFHPKFPDSPHAVLAPDLRWFPADEALRETGVEKLMPWVEGSMAEFRYFFAQQEAVETIPRRTVRWN